MLKFWVLVRGLGWLQVEVNPDGCPDGRRTEAHTLWYAIAQPGVGRLHCTFRGRALVVPEHAIDAIMEGDELPPCNPWQFFSHVPDEGPSRAAP